MSEGPQLLPHLVGSKTLLPTYMHVSYIFSYLVHYHLDFQDSHNIAWLSLSISYCVAVLFMKFAEYSY